MSGVVDAPGTFSPHLLVGIGRMPLCRLRDRRGASVQRNPCLPVSHRRPRTGRSPRVFEHPCSAWAAVEWPSPGPDGPLPAEHLSPRGPELAKGNERFLHALPQFDSLNGGWTRKRARSRQSPMDSYPDGKQTDQNSTRSVLPRLHLSSDPGRFATATIPVSHSFRSRQRDDRRTSLPRSRGRRKTEVDDRDGKARLRWRAGCSVSRCSRLTRHSLSYH